MSLRAKGYSTRGSGRTQRTKVAFSPYAVEALESRTLLTTLFASPNGTQSGNSYSTPASLSSLFASGGTVYSDLSSGDVTVYLEAPVIDANNPPGVGPYNYAADTYQLTQTLNLNPSTIGTFGHKLTITNWQPGYPASYPILSGGATITDWVQLSTASSSYANARTTMPNASSIYVAHVPTDAATGTKPEYRDLFVNGQRAVRARTANLDSNAALTQFLDFPNGAPTVGYPNFNNVAIPKSVAPDLLSGSTLYNNLGTTYTLTGSSTAVPNPNDVELVVYDSYNHFRVRLDQVVSTTFVNPPTGVSYDVFRLSAKNASDYNALGLFPAAVSVFYLENALGFLDSPGEWYEDLKNGLIYYWPRGSDIIASAGGNILTSLNTAGVVVAPQPLSDTTFPFTPPQVNPALPVSGFTPDSPPLLQIGATSSTGTQVSNISIQGIHFDYSAWMYPALNGYSGLQAGIFVAGGSIAPAVKRANMTPKAATATSGFSTRLLQQDVAESAVNIYAASTVSISGCTFEHLGGAGLTLYGGLAGSTPSSNTISKNTFSDIASNGIIVNGDPRDQQNAAMVSSGDTIADNSISATGQDYPDAAAILAVYVKNLSIQYNTIFNTSWSAVAVTDVHENSAPSTVYIVSNNIFGFNRVLQDGAGVYMDGNNYAGSGAGSIVEYNYIHDALWPRSTPVSTWPPSPLTPPVFDDPAYGEHDAVRLDSPAKSGSVLTAGVTVSNNVLGNQLPGTIKIPNSSAYGEPDLTPYNEQYTYVGQSNLGYGLTIRNLTERPLNAVNATTNLFTGNNPSDSSSYDSIVITAGVRTAQFEVPSTAYTNANPNANPTITTYTSGTYAGITTVMPGSNNQFFTYWPYFPESGEYMLNLRYSTNDTNDTASVSLGLGTSSPVVSGIRLSSTGGHTGGALNLAMTVPEVLQVSAGFHPITIQFFGSLTQLEVAGISLVYQPTTPTFQHQSGFPQAANWQNPWIVDASLKSASQVISFTTYIGTEGIYSLELRSATQSKVAKFNIVVKNAAGTTIQSTSAPVTAPYTGSLSNPKYWMLDPNTFTIGTTASHAVSGVYTIQITYVGSSTPLLLEHIELLPDFLYP